MKKLLSWLKKEWYPLVLFGMFIVILLIIQHDLRNIIHSTQLPTRTINLFQVSLPTPLPSGPIESRFTLYEDEENKVDCYILDEGKANQTMSCIPNLKTE